MSGMRFMNRSKGAALSLVACLILGICASPAFWPADQALARGPAWGPRPPTVIPRLPAGHHRMDWRGHRYYYHGGHFFRHHDRGFVLVAPPFGLVVASLPFGYASLVLGGITYFTYLGVYYRHVPAGYMVVAPPPTAPPAPVAPRASYASVTVTAPSLNVRQGPSMGHPVLGVVTLGDTLAVLDTTPGWLYVQTSSGLLGWVDQRFTSPLSSGASG